MTQVAQQIDNEEKPPYNIDLTYHSVYNTDTDEYADRIVTYEDIIGYQVSGTVVAVMTKEGETFVIPIEQLKLIRHYPQAV